MKYKVLRGEMVNRNVTIEAVSDLLEIHRNSVANKLNGKSSFSIEESVKIRDAFFPRETLEHLFKTEEG